MKQFLFLSVLTMGCGLGALYEPFWGIFLYYVFGVMRPQYLWKWALPFQAHWSLIAAVIVFVSLAAHLPRMLERMRWNVVASLLLAYALMVMLTVVTANYPALAQSWAIETAKILLMALLATAVIDRLWQVKLLAMMILLSLGEVAYEVNSMYYFQNHRLDIFHYGYGGYDNNGAGLLLALAIPFAYCFAIGAAKGGWRIVKYAAPLLGVLLIQAVMMTYSRGAMLATVVGLTWLLFHHRPRWQAAVMALVIVLVVARLAGPSIRDRFISTEHYQTDPSARVRLEAWHAAWDMTWEHPVFGLGVRNSKFFMKNYNWNLRFRTVHNQYLQMAADSGVITAGLYIVMLFAGLISLSSARRSCLRWLALRQRLADGPATDGVRMAEKLCLAIQASLLTFVVGSFFLSVEDFETAWLLVVLAGVMPQVVTRYLGEIEEAPTGQAEPSAAPRPAEPEPRKMGPNGVMA